MPGVPGRLTQQEVADFLELARTTVTALEKGEGRIRPDELISLDRAVRTPGQHFCRVQGFALREIARRFAGPVQKVWVVA